MGRILTRRNEVQQTLRGLLPFPARHELPRPPVEIADEVELYARESGRHATVQFVPTWIENGRAVEGTWMIRFTLRPDDKRMQLYRDGQVATPPTEEVWLHVPDPAYRSGFRPLDLREMGVSGVREFLERGNTWSGRGEYASFSEQVQRAREAEEAQRTALRNDRRDDAVQRAKGHRRTVLKIPFLRVGVEVRDSVAAPATEPEAPPADEPAVTPRKEPCDSPISRGSSR